MEIRLASPVQPDSIVDGEGIRTVLWTQGCTWHCFNCHNKETWDPKGGFSLDVDIVLAKLLASDQNITFSGGDPLFQSEAVAYLVEKLKKENKNIWLYTGYTFEDLLKISKKDDNIREILEHIDVLVDGPFVNNLKSFNYTFRGSKNQRLIDVPSSLKQKKTVKITKYDDKPLRAREEGIKVYI